MKKKIEFVKLLNSKFNLKSKKKFNNEKRTRSLNFRLKTLIKAA